MEPWSGCLINAVVEVLGDHWSLLVLCDVIFGDRRYFRAPLTGSIEGIASNILADRLVRSVGAGILTRRAAARGERVRYSLTEADIQTVPVIYALGNWVSTGVRVAPSSVAGSSSCAVRVLRSSGNSRTGSGSATSTRRRGHTMAPRAAGTSRRRLRRATEQ